MSLRPHPGISASLLSVALCLLVDGFLTRAAAETSSLAQLFQEYRQQQGAGVVVGAVPLRKIGNGVGGVLKYPRRVSQP